MTSDQTIELDIPLQMSHRNLKVFKYSKHFLEIFSSDVAQTKQ
jgi:hypothetical protein